MFLLGMKHLSEGLQAVSGSGLRKFMSLATTHRLAGVGTGLVSTVIVQSSSLVKSPRPSFDLAAVQAQSKTLHELVRTSRQGQLNRVGANDPNSPVRVLVELDILNAYERVRAYYLNIAETLAGGK